MSTFGTSFLAELIKLRRSAAWLVAVLLPALAVLTGSVNFQANQGVLSSGWESLTSQITLFYGLFFYSLGVCLLVSLAWRAEHQSWNLTATSTGMGRLLLAKTCAVVPMLVAMQMVIVAGTGIAGLVLGVSGGVPWKLLLVGVVGVWVAVPLVVLQSVISAVVRSFAMSVALGFLGVFVALGISAQEGVSALAWVVPQALVTRGSLLGSTAVSSAGGLADAWPLLVGATSLGSGLWWVGAEVMRWRLLR